MASRLRNRLTLLQRNALLVNAIAERRRTVLGPHEVDGSLLDHTLHPGDGPIVVACGKPRDGKVNVGAGTQVLIPGKGPEENDALGVKLLAK